MVAARENIRRNNGSPALKKRLGIGLSQKNISRNSRFAFPQQMHSFHIALYVTSFSNAEQPQNGHFKAILSIYIPDRPERGAPRLT
jgi:hypothetical protein